MAQRKKRSSALTSHDRALAIRFRVPRQRLCDLAADSASAMQQVGAGVFGLFMHEAARSSGAFASAPASFGRPRRLSSTSQPDRLGIVLGHDPAPVALGAALSPRLLPRLPGLFLRRRRGPLRRLELQ